MYGDVVTAFVAVAQVPVNRRAVPPGDQAGRHQDHLIRLFGFTGTVNADARAGRQPKVYPAGGTFGDWSAGTKRCVAAQID